MSEASICFLPHLQGVGGPISFQARLRDAMLALGVNVHFDPRRQDTTAILLFGATRNLIELRRAQARGVRIVQRLNGMNWLHRAQRTSLRYALRCEMNNLLLATARRRLASHIIYQSHFSQQWWERVYGPLNVPASVTYNGVNLAHFSPEGPHQRPMDRFRLLLVEGHMIANNEQGIKNAAELVRLLNHRLKGQVELYVVGDIAAGLRQEYEQLAEGCITWGGVVDSREIPTLDRSAHALFSADLNASCPNSVTEALACGLPVVSYATGALPEMLASEGGLTAPYGGNPWKLEKPDSAALADATGQVFEEQNRFRASARRRAEAVFDIQKTAQEYMEVLRG